MSIQPGPKDGIFSRLSPLILGNHHASKWHWKVLYHSIIAFVAKLFSLPAGIRNCTTTNRISIVQSCNHQISWFLFQKSSSQNLLILLHSDKMVSSIFPTETQETNLEFILPRAVFQLHSFITSPCPFISASVLTKAGVAGVCLEGCFRCCIQNMKFQLRRSRRSSCFVH